MSLGNKIFTSLLLGWALRVRCTKLGQNLLKGRERVLHRNLLLPCNYLPIEQPPVVRRANPERIAVRKPLVKPRSHTHEQHESEDEISIDPDHLESFQYHHATVISETLEENIPLVSSEDGNVDTASCVPADTENENFTPSPPSPTVHCASNPPLPATSPRPQRSRRMPTRLTYYAPGNPVYCQSVSLRCQSVTIDVL